MKEYFFYEISYTLLHIKLKEWKTVLTYIFPGPFLWRSVGGGGRPFSPPPHPTLPLPSSIHYRSVHLPIPPCLSPPPSSTGLVWHRTCFFYLVFQGLSPSLRGNSIKSFAASPLYHMLWRFCSAQYLLSLPSIKSWRFRLTCCLSPPSATGFIWPSLSLFLPFIISYRFYLTQSIATPPLCHKLESLFDPVSRCIYPPSSVTGLIRPSLSLPLPSIISYRLYLAQSLATSPLYHKL